MRIRRALAGGLLVGLATVSGVQVVAAASSLRSDPAHVALAARNSEGSVSPSISGEILEQTLDLNVVGGPLRLETSSASVVLTRRPGSDREWIGTMPPVRVVDARGTLAGWEVRWFMESVELDGSIARRPDWATVSVDPAGPVVVDGAPEGLEAGGRRPATRPGRALMHAMPGNGGGTYEADGTVLVKLPGSVSAEHMVVNLTFALR